VKINFVFLALAFGIAALAGYALFAANNREGGVPLANALGGGIALFVTLAGTIAVSAESKGASMNIRLLSKTFFGIILAQQVVFTLLPFRMAPYVIVTGVLALVYLTVVYGAGRALMK
jgi:hypothetical protein